MRGAARFRSLAGLWLASVVWSTAQSRGGTAAVPARAAAPIDLAGYLSLIVDEWRLRVSPQKGDIPYFPSTPPPPPRRQSMGPGKGRSGRQRLQGLGRRRCHRKAWAPAHQLGKRHHARRRCGRRNRLLHFDPAPKKHSVPSWQGDSSAEWQFSSRAMLDLGGLGFVRGGGPDPGARPSGTLKIVTTNMLPGCLRKNGCVLTRAAVVDDPNRS